MISIVLTTYNGEPFLTAQLDSIRNQDVYVDEVLIRDDGSTDRTVQIIKDYISLHKLNNWKLIYGQENVGWKKNFYEGIKLASGDLIYLCDQDDIWHTNKVRKIKQAMEDNPHIELLTSGFHIFYQDDACKLTNDGDLINDDSLRQVPFDKRCLTISYPGCTFCFRKSLKDRFLKYWFDESPHDAMLWYLALQSGSLYNLNSVLMEYRRHPKSATNDVGIHSIEKKLEVFRRHSSVIEMLQDIGVNEENAKLLARMKHWYLLRIELLEKRNPFLALKIIPYLDCYIKFRHFVLDILLAIRGY